MVRYDYPALMTAALTVLLDEPTKAELADELGVAPRIAGTVIHKLRALAGKHNAAIVTVKKGYQGQTRYRLTTDAREVAGWRLIQSRDISTRIGTIRSQMRVELAGTSGRTGYGKSIRRAERMLVAVADELEAAVAELEEELA